MFALRTIRPAPIRLMKRFSSSDNNKNDNDDHTNTPNEKKDYRTLPEHPIKRTIRVIGNDIKSIINDIVPNKFDYKHYNSERNTHYSATQFCDVAVIGGGIMGSSIAYWLKYRGSRGLKVVVIEKDPTYAKASTVLSVGGLRQQFSLEENILMSQYAAEFFRDIPNLLGNVDLQFTPHGYLLLGTEKTADQLEQNYKLQQSLKVKNILLTPKELKTRFPWLNTDDIVCGCLGMQDEGWFDPWSLLHGFRNRALDLGVEYIHGEVVGFNYQKSNNQTIVGVPMGEFEKIKSCFVKTVHEVSELTFSVAVIAAGANSGEVAKLANIGTGDHPLLRIPLPVEPRKRFVYCFSSRDENIPGVNTPMTFDQTGTYFRREGLSNNFIGGRAPSAGNEPSIENLDVDYNFFEEEVWPCLALRVPAFQGVKVNSAWAGYYEFNTYDENGIIGAHPYHFNIFMAAGFSGHGIQQAPAVGRAISELILDSEFTTIDLSKLSFDRLLMDLPMYESNIF